nr:response regulator transcription factor [Pigmentiphaga kullae]
MTRLLIVEDQLPLAENIMEYLGEERYALDFAYDGLTALHLLSVNQYDVIVLDVMLPALSGLELCRRVRSELGSFTPIILVTARSEMEDKMEGFDSGADDYLVKPFDLRELKARIEALHRRSSGRKKVVRAGVLAFDQGTLILSLDSGPSVELGSSGAMIFETLIKCYPNFVSYEDLMAELSGKSREVDSNTLRTHVYNLRRLLKLTTGADLIRTVRGRGYRLVQPGEE